MRVHVALGANLGDAPRTVRSAIAVLDLLPGVSVAASSRLYRSEAIGPPGQPDYMNAVIAADVRHEPTELLRMLQGVEHAFGRQRSGERWSARTLDLDIVLCGEQVITTETLTVPHPRLTERAFVLLPLAEIAPDAQLPDGRRIADLAAAVDARGIVDIEPMQADVAAFGTR